MITITLNFEQLRLVLISLRSTARDIYSEATPTNDREQFAQGDEYTFVANLIETLAIDQTT